MSSKWKKAQLAFRTKMCLLVPGDSNESPSQSSDAVSLSPATPYQSSVSLPDMPSTPVPSSSGLRLPRHSSKSSKKICAICLNAMKAGHGAIFTAECSHAFHFHCISSNVKHGNQMCPICRAKWKEIPFQSPSSDTNTNRGRTRNVSGAWPQDQWVTVVRQLPSPIVDIPSPRHISSLFHAREPSIFNDDELVISQQETSVNVFALGNNAGTLDLEVYPEISAVPRLACHPNFTVLVHLKAPSTARQPDQSSSRVPVDLVTVLDVSGSMSGTKIALLKRAMGFVIQNLGPYDRLSVISFSSTARRLFPLRRMTNIGKQEALQLVNSLTSGGGTNIADGLKKGAKVMTDRKSKNPVSGIILLSDGQDTHTVSSRSTDRHPDYASLLPVTMHRDNSAGVNVPVHTFGFGIDHDSVAMHSISEKSGGTFSFIEAESVIQDAFAQCIGGLLSVVIQELVVHVECLHPSLKLSSIKAGSYRMTMESGNRKGSVDIGDLYAEEERDFLVTLDIPAQEYNDVMPVLKINCVYKDPVSKEHVTLNPAGEVKIPRPETTGELTISVEVDRQRNRLRSAECMAEARAAAERGDLAAAVSILENCRRLLVESASYKAGDGLCSSLEADLREMQERMANPQVYETSGRAYVLSGMSSHSWQRATVHGDSTDRSSYQTPSMVDMVTRSQTLIMGSGTPSPQRTIRPVLSFPARPSRR